MKSTRRTFLAGASALGAGTLLIAAGTGRFGTAWAQDGKTLVFAAAGTVTSSWDPSSHTIAPQITAEALVFGRLTKCLMKPDNPGEILPDLALEWKVIDKFTLEYKLRQGVKFHDGKEFKAEDVKATYEYASQPSRPASAWYPGQVEVEIVDDYTVRLKTEKFGYPALNFWYVSAFLPILSAKDVADPNVLKQRPNGTGAFRYAETKGDQIVFKSNDTFYDGKPEIETLLWTYVPDANTRVLGLLNGQYHLTERLEPEQYESLKAQANIVTNSSLSSENKYLHFRCNKPPFDDVRVRLAAAHAIDRDQVLAVVGEAAKASSSHISPVKFGYVDVPNYPKYDPELCQKLLAEAGFPKGAGLPELEYITSVGFYPKTREYGELITAMLQEQGFPVKLTTLEPAAWEEQIYRRADGQGPGHIIDVGWITGSPEPDLVLRPNYHSKFALINGINDAEIDASLDKERNAGSTEERLKVLQEETLPLLAAKVPSLSLFSSVFLRAMSKNLEGAYFYPNGPIDLSKAKLS
ncbi:ABC transporter substrate-binding protein [Mesorhizobium sp. INR15]|uniref:ABC transporter substrate-binding protein n=1 Tax=Mesorhizobium sp. INR15 TaxID=2654248 RepID=UPI00189677C5|nr:ABC transporter substrate-binding protein [Mesorhizobium sp. INR15]QPC94514.1 ABC transporter substrate-binding protein [Mesorhizobium sp. INR15]